MFSAAIAIINEDQHLCRLSLINISRLTIVNKYTSILAEVFIYIYT